MNDLFDFEALEPPRARTTDPATSHAAAFGIEKKVTKLQGIIVDCLRSSYAGATTGEMSIALGIPRDTLSPRMRTLEKMGMVMETDEVRALPGGRSQIVWKAI